MIVTKLQLAAKVKDQFLSKVLFLLLINFH